MKEIIQEMDPKPSVIQPDAGSEFTSRLFGQLMKSNNIKLEIANTADHNRQGIVERFNRTLRGYIERFKSANSTVSYIDSLPQLVNNYNNSFNRGLGGIPAETVAPNYELEAKKLALASSKSFKVGDQVRYVINPTTFMKGSAPRWSKTLHTIESKDVNRYMLSNGK